MVVLITLNMYLREVTSSMMKSLYGVHLLYLISEVKEPNDI